MITRTPAPPPVDNGPPNVAMEPVIRFQRLAEDAQTPVRATVESVGLDVFAYIKNERRNGDTILLPPRTTRMIPTRLIVVPPPGHVIFVCSRSGLAKDRSIFVTNAPGIIDPDYRGELFVLLYNGGHENHWVRHGDRVGQLLALPMPRLRLEETQTLDTTERGDKGFGSSGR